MIDYAHQLGMRFFVGGGLGAWSGTYMLTNREEGTMRVNSTDEGGNDVSNWSLCPANEKSRAALIAYYNEMFDTLPEADGLYIESADEFGECQCPRCSKPVDELGSRMFGQYQLSLMQHLMHDNWQKHPQQTRLTEARQAIENALANASPKARETLTLMKQTIEDIVRQYKMTAIEN